MSLGASSSSTLWATGPAICTSEHSSQLTRVNVASKEWIIPAKPKPGRKPKAEPSPMKDDEVPDFLLRVAHSLIYFVGSNLTRKGDAFRIGILQYLITSLVLNGLHLGLHSVLSENVSSHNSPNCKLVFNHMSEGRWNVTSPYKQLQNDSKKKMRSFGVKISCSKNNW
jgi:hypothetical protein